MRSARLFLISVLTLISSLAFGRSFDVTRTDGSRLRVHLELPNQTTFPVVVLIHGSTCTSSFPMFSSTAPALLKAGIAVVALEKYGLDESSTACPASYLENNTIQGRILDHLQLIAYLGQNLPGWNKRLAWAGGSEGGQVASLVAHLVPETRALLMLASGGGMTMAEELPLAFTRSLKRQGATEAEIQKSVDDIHQHYQEIRANPVSSLEWLSDGKIARNTYKYWNSILWLKALPLLETM